MSDVDRDSYGSSQDPPVDLINYVQGTPQGPKCVGPDLIPGNEIGLGIPLAELIALEEDPSIDFDVGSFTEASGISARAAAEIDR